MDVESCNPTVKQKVTNMDAAAAGDWLAIVEQDGSDESDCRSGSAAVPGLLEPGSMQPEPWSGMTGGMW